MSISDWIMQINKNHILIAIIIILIIVSLILNYRRENQKSAPPITYLSSTNIDTEHFEAKDLPKEKSVNLNLYYTEWCGYSQQFLPVWSEFEKYATNNNLAVTTNKFDCDKEKEKCQSVEGFPTLTLEKDGKRTVMSGKYPRTVDGILKFIAENI